MSILKQSLPLAIFTLFLMGTIAVCGQDVEPRPLVPLGTASVSSGPTNQQIADAVARTLKQSSLLHRYHIDIQVGDGEVELRGRVTDAAQKEEVLRLARGVPGVQRLRDRLETPGEGGILRVQALPLGEQGPVPQKLDAQGQPPLGTLPPVNPSMPQDPLPISQAPQYDPMMHPPPMPPYAWPAYAPYNNYSRVAYPQLYPYEAWPFIGPFYPFPKVPPGWRSVTLTWNDGFWWYGKNATGHDWWRVKYR